MEVSFFRPQIGEEEIAEVVDSLRNGWLTTGAKTKRFEQDFAAYLGGGVEAIAVNSATSGLHLALEAAGIGPGDEVIVPSYTFTATAEVVRYLGADPVFVDCDYDTLCVTAYHVAPALTERTRAIMPVHFGGMACDMQPLIDLAAENGLMIIEDAAHSLPATSGGVLVGKQPTTATIFSFYANKTITTGEGGMLVTADPEIAARAKIMRQHGIDRDAFDRFATGRWVYDVVAPGYKYNLTDIASAIGIHQLRKVGEFHSGRMRVAARYREQLDGLPIDLPAEAPDGETHSWHLFIVKVRPEAPLDRDAVFAELGRRGIVCSVHYRPLHRMTYWRERYNLHAQHFPNAERVFARAISLPIHAGMTDGEIDFVCSSLRQVLS
ncbi:dTDP-4-amino-4,6-dideoxygalactose transaminase [Mesorhizobium sp. J18]|uniref:DegT/DnrJ/EryC1/StrS family aminotransferase n=1 Tax=Mesorhizobium sp. J18 TaxID=935263 RepID=UPI00119A35D2|nr:DegT/DnrJ/EryC1/StrS family aminotransferase [Mesorhizobium sp. J18]TWG94769.1 dTDP-4-amino-4,6-dideoxygalactose transaminase [Mesorhizobium sp. J18]